MEIAAQRLSNEDFFVQLSNLLADRREKCHGSIFLTQKSLHDPSAAPTADHDNPLADLHPSLPRPLLLRATDGKSKQSRADRIKISTVVQPDALDGFFARYADVCKAGMQALKKRDRSGRKKAKAKKQKKKGVAVAEGEEKAVGERGG